MIRDQTTVSREEDGGPQPGRHPQLLSLGLAKGAEDVNVELEAQGGFSTRSTSISSFSVGGLLPQRTKI
jgi:hypothetical protein